MSGWFIFTLVLAVPTAILIAIAFLSPSPRRDRDSLRYMFLVWASVLGVITFLFLLVSSTHSVPTKTVGVVTSFGKPTGVLSNGLHWIKPWEKVVEFDASYQTLKRTGDDKCTTVRLKNQAQACVDNSTRWRIKQDAAPQLYQDYKTFSNMRDSLVHRELGSVLNAVFADYDPLTAVEDPDAEQPAYSLDVMGDRASDMLRERVGEQVEISSVVISLVRYDGTTQKKLDDYQAAMADTRIADQRRQTAEKDAAANNAVSGSLNESVLVERCLDLVKEIYRDGKELPPGFTCLGSGVPVIANSK